MSSLPAGEPAKLLRIFIGEADRWHGHPLYQALLELLRREGIAGATVQRGLAGYGAHSTLHTARVLRMSEDLPLIIDVVESAAAIAAILPQIEAMVDGGLITLSDVTVVAHRPHRDKP